MFRAISSRRACVLSKLQCAKKALSTSSSPPPIRVAYTADSAGRGTFATRRLRSGDLIHTADPLITHPSPSLLNKVCYLCLRRSGPSTAADETDPTVRFCGEDCKLRSQGFYKVEKRADWSAFDDHSRLQGLKYPFLVKRLACMVISGAATVESLDILQPANLFPEILSEGGPIINLNPGSMYKSTRFSSIVDRNLDESDQMEEEFGLLKDALLKAGFNEQIAFLTKQWYIGVLARIRINAFRVELAGGSYEDLLSEAAAAVAAESAVGNAIYMLPSFYNHDCDPNAHMVWIENAHARLKALRDVEAGEELRICYIDASMDHDARQTILSQGFGFHCQCLRCMSGD
ncbi:histone-lysine N-methyltransferase ATXR4-like protein [Cinnamomum micranthum f. kanehirae]|uniref:Histone-lysine N-methyltransferase ATXR4-like protein n=1 Tax=Cinnamomum micranthum f. kanehirae TaxID=337451 RepID=A0A3S3NRG4_9MAGN|nr:histone-lysine N-methyltransferase ATXR4-like protein [Cinnamomum micranthum f. kanehirae]